MNFRVSATIAAAATLWANGAMAQDAAPAQAQTMDAAPAAGPSTEPEWWVFSRAPTRHYLIDVHSVEKTGDELTVMVARVSTETPAGDYSHTLDQFGIRCDARQSHVVASSEATADGTPEEAFVTDEPWEAIIARSFDDGIRQISCDTMRPDGTAYPSVKAYIDASRP